MRTLPLGGGIDTSSFSYLPHYKDNLGAVLTSLNIDNIWQGVNIPNAWDSWWGEASEPKTRNLPLLVSWHIWLGRNFIIFQDKPVNWNMIPCKICSRYEEIPTKEINNRPRNITQEQIDKSKPWAYFDGAAQA